MGLMSTMTAGLGFGRAAGPALGGVTRDMARQAVADQGRAPAEAMDQPVMPDTSARVSAPGASGFDRRIDAVNRLPRPLMAFGSQALVVYAMVDPSGFSTRMAGLNAMPEALWWLLGAIVTAYFGAREAHHLRNRTAPAPRPVVQAPDVAPEAGLSGPNPALDDWRSQG